jgi:hypothetical protein
MHASMSTAARAAAASASAAAVALAITAGYSPASGRNAFRLNIHRMSSCRARDDGDSLVVNRTIRALAPGDRENGL